MRASPYRRLLVLLDGTDRGERTLAWVRHLARGPGSVVHLLMIEPAARAIRVDGRTVGFVDQLEDGARAAARAYLAPVAARLREDGATVWTHVRVRAPAAGARAVILDAGPSVRRTLGAASRGIRRAASRVSRLLYVPRERHRNLDRPALRSPCTVDSRPGTDRRRRTSQWW